MKSKITFLFVVHFLVLMLLLPIIGKLIPQQYYPNRETVLFFVVPSFAWIEKFATFDGQHYISIAQKGYEQYEQAFFPLYPIGIYFVSKLFSGNLLTAGFLLSNIEGVLGIILFFCIIERLYNKKMAYMTTVFFLAYPASFYLHNVYTESTFLFTLTLAWYLMTSDSMWFVVPAMLTSATRFSGIITGILSIDFIELFKKRRVSWSEFYVLVMPMIGLACYSYYLHVAYHDALYFLHAQPAFGAGRSSHIVLLPQVYYRYLKIFLTVPWSFRYFIALLECSLFTFLGITSLLWTIETWKRKDSAGVSVGFFSLAYLIIPTLTGTFLSMPRYGIFSFASFLWLAQLKNTFLKYSVLAIFIVLQAILFGFASQGWFVS